MPEEFEHAHDIADDASLVRRIALGDEPALAALVQRHRPTLVRWAGRIASDRGLAEDAVQEALTSVWRFAAGFREDSSVRAWLATLVRHAVWRELRKRRHDEAHAPEEELEALGARAGWGDPTLGGHVEAVVGSRECLEHAFARLQVADREVLGLVDVEGASLEEASAALELGLAAVKSRLHRARLRLVAALREEECDAG